MGTIMGVGYDRELTQWSQGEYPNANETEDDLAIITTQNGFGYRVDTVGNTTGTATTLSFSGGSATFSTIIERNTDVDYFQFTVVAGSLSFSVSPFSVSPNLDILAELYNSSGGLITAVNPPAALNATYSGTVTAGTYYIAISGVGAGNLTTGYSDYGSLGQFTLSVTAATVSAPEVTVLGNGLSIADGETPPTITHGTDFGSVVQNTSVSRTFTVRNDGNLTLTLGNLSVPSGFTITDGLVASLAAGASDTFTVQVDSSSLGTKSGQISFTSNDADEATFNFSITASVVADSTGNDSFANRVSLSGVPATASGSNVGSTKQTGEPNHGGNSGGASVWWSWTAPSNQVVSINTFGSGFDTTLGVYTGSSVNALSLVAGNDDSGDGTQSQVVFSAVAGVTYQIAVDGFNGATGSITLNITSGSVAGNNNFGNALLLTGTETTANGSNSGATAESGEPSHAGEAATTSVWWYWTAIADGSVQVDTFGSNFDTILAVYVGSSVNALTGVVSNDDAAGGGQSLVTWTAAAGTTYRIAVQGYAGASGAITLNLTYVDTMSFYGTGGNDVVIIDLGSRTGSINGLSVYVPEGVSDVYAYGQGGSDDYELIGAPGLTFTILSMSWPG
ncbi:MAG: choice-of-anchor D domain-containing protein [Planctomycetaceae bacterium]